MTNPKKFSMADNIEDVAILLNILQTNMIFIMRAIDTYKKRRKMFQKIFMSSSVQSASKIRKRTPIYDKFI